MNDKITEDLYGLALLDYYHGNKNQLFSVSSIAGKDEFPLDHLFRSFEQMPKLEQLALQLSRGKILDLGCGAGSHALYLENNDFDVTALDKSGGAAEVCALRGLKKVMHKDIWDLKKSKFDTIVLLMNGIGICRTLDRLGEFFLLLKSLLNPKGQILLDSSDIAYMYTTESGETDIPLGKHYYGEVEFYLTYKQQKSPKFNWLYVDFYNLEKHANEAGLHCECIYKGSNDEYLAKVTLLP